MTVLLKKKRQTKREGREGGGGGANKIYLRNKGGKFPKGGSFKGDAGSFPGTPKRKAIKKQEIR